jgi:predicted ATPase/class 3 adenylate cyclase
VRHDLPTGTVTFLFTDVEGSTRLLESLGSEEFADALSSHRTLIRAALAAHGGTEVDTQGDAFFCAFASARSAVACAQEIQSRLAETPIRVRIGVHSGEALLAEDRYVGLDVHRGARIGACGHGGQVVLSPATVGLLEPGSFTLSDLGEHRLKDLSAPIRLHQLGDGEFAPLKTLFRTNLPVVATEFLGREDELRELVELASRPSLRLLTLTGPGGTGKTRIALQAAGELAEAFPDGVRWASLASLRDSGLVASAVAEAVEVEEEPGESILAAVARALSGKRLLLLVDNCEHVLEAAADVVSRLLASCPEVLLLATSREPLAVAGEHVYPVQPLSSWDAVNLFDARASAAGAQPGTDGDGRAAVEALCARLDNLPLAVELAAARAAVLPPAAMLAVLSERLDVLKGPRDADERQRTLRGTIAWSHDLLDQREQQAFRRLSVFAGGASLESVEAVCEADLDELFSLVAKSLVRRQGLDDSRPRYWMLETIREYAASLLEESGEAAEYRQRHLRWFAALARDTRDRLSGPGSSLTLELLERDRENLRAALSWALGRAEDGGDGDGDDAIAIGAVLAPLHMLHGRYAEAEEVLRGMLALAPGSLDAAFAYSRLARVLRHRGAPDEGLEAHLEAERVLEAVRERDESWWWAWIDVKLRKAHHHYFEGDTAALGALIDEVRPQVEQRATPMQELEFLHVVAQYRYRRERYALSEETEELIRGLHRRSIALEEVDADFTLGFCLLWREKLDEAGRYFDHGLESARERGDALIEVRCLVYGAVCRRKQGDVDGTRALLNELDRLDDLHGYGGLVSAVRAWIALREGDHDAVERFAEAAFEDWQPGLYSGPRVFQWTARFPVLAVELARGRLEVALEQGRAMLDSFQQPLPTELHAALAQAVEDEDSAKLEHALDLARARGYA